MSRVALEFDLKERWYMNNVERANRNLFDMRMNPYPGRGIVIGMSEDGRHAIQVYWIMGRSENSRNRVFSSDIGRVFTEAADPSKVSDPSLIIYNAMMDAPLNDHFIVSNGSQTDVVTDLMNDGVSLEMALSDFKYEPDAPNFTPRITGTYSTEAQYSKWQLAIQRHSRWGESCDRELYQYEHIADGYGHCITTYAGNGDPLPAFRGNPLLMPLRGDIRRVAETYWGTLNTANRVALAVKFISLSNQESEVYLINKHEKVDSLTESDV